MLYLLYVGIDEDLLVLLMLLGIDGNIDLEGNVEI